MQLSSLGRKDRDVPSDHPSCEVDQTIRPPLEVVGHRLDIAASEPAGHDLLDVGHSVSGRVLQVIEVRRGEDENAAVEAADADDPAQALGEDGTRFENSIVIGIDQPPHLTRILPPQRQRLLRQADLCRVRISSHLSDQEIPELIKAAIDRVIDDWLMRHQIERKTMLYHKGLLHIGHLDRRESTDLNQIGYWASSQE